MNTGGVPGIFTLGARFGGTNTPGTYTGLWWIVCVHATLAYASRSGSEACHSRSRSRAARNSAASARALVSRSAADGYGSDGSDAGRSTASAAPSRRGDGDSEEEDSGENEARAGPAYRVRRRGRRAASSYVRDDDIDLDDVL